MSQSGRRQLIEAELKRQLVECGFRSSRVRFVRSLAQDFSGALGFSGRISRSPYGVWFFPVVGVRWEPAQCVIDAILGLSSASSQSTVVSPVYLIDRALPRDWRVEPDSVAQDISRMVESIVPVALAFMERMACPEALADALKDGVDTSGRLLVAYPVVLRLAGDAAAAMQFVEAVLATLGGDVSHEAVHKRSQLEATKGWLLTRAALTSSLNRNTCAD